SITLAVYAYKHGGATAVGIVALIRTIPAAMVAPFAAILGDRYPRERVMVFSDLSRVVVTGVAAALVFVNGPSALVYFFASAQAVLGTAFGPAESAILPLLADTPEELTAANVTTSTIES